MTELLGLYASGSHVLREFAVFSITQDAHRRQGKLVCGVSDKNCVCGASLTYTHVVNIFKP
jgi:hypothetical protein